MSDSQRVAIVTGAAQGIGRAIALRLADDGIDVALNDVPGNVDNLTRVAEEIRAKGRRAITIPGDVSVEEEVKALVDRTTAALGGVDIMVANAGVGPTCPLVEMNVKTWDRTIAVNLTGVMLCYKYAALQMIKQKRGGRILGALQCSAYCATKFGVRGITQSLGLKKYWTALELAEHNITVNAYCPGVIVSPMTTLETDMRYGGRPGATIKALLGIPLDSPEVGPDVIASVVSYLVKPEAHFITGQSIDVNGGTYMG
ncbi:hypothetical protein IEO21_05489 [Rhodonia placenta]|uniref:3-oxoacyl-[acyl-carrier-protein] reductase n=1 Tax=Rhodonia placenta TaxID=104341 RepID=A0A8H7U1K2_9APHY|nr:hypothetical protein IEO21_05489 [Postia placenta]